jgi:hypothetical protein
MIERLTEHDSQQNVKKGKECKASDVSPTG